jgi:hypothetical protein
MFGERPELFSWLLSLANLVNKLFGTRPRPTTMYVPLPLCGYCVTIYCTVALHTYYMVHTRIRPPQQLTLTGTKSWILFSSSESFEKASNSTFQFAGKSFTAPPIAIFRMCNWKMHCTKKKHSFKTLI